MITSLQTAMIILVIHILMLVLLLILSVRLIIINGRKLTTVFMAFCFALWLLTDLYWFIYDYMRPESRMPFAANEIGEAAVFLMMAATLNSAVLLESRLPVHRTACALVFSACNVALWIAWSGEWIQDILFGAVYAWFICSVVRALTIESVLRRWEWISLGGLCTLLIAGQALAFGQNDSLKNFSGSGCYVLLVIGVLYFVYKLIRGYLCRTGAQALISISFALMAWIMTGKYMSDAGWYNLFLLLETITLPLWYLSARKVVSVA